MRQTQTKSNEVLDKIFAQDKATPYFLEENFEWHRLVREIAPIQATRREEWDFTMGVLLAMVGRFEESQQCFLNSLRLSYDPNVAHNLMQSILASGNYERAQDAFREHGHPNRGLFGVLGRIGLECCAFSVVAEYKSIAIQMGLEIDPFINPAEELVEFQREVGLNDVDFARHMTIAGNICVKYRVKPVMKRVWTQRAGGGELFSILFVVPKTADEVFELNIELAQAEEEAGIEKKFAFDVAFCQTLPSDPVLENHR